MPNFDQCERLIRNFLCENITLIDAARQIYSLPEAQKIRLLKDKSEKEINDFLSRSQSSLNTIVPGSGRFITYDDNAHGKDLYKESTGAVVELKSGSDMTDANSGLSIFCWAIGDEEKVTVDIFKEGVSRRREMLLKGSASNEIESSKKESMNRLYNHLLTLLSPGQSYEKLSHYLKCIGRGITTGSKIIGSYEKDKDINFPIMLKASWEQGLTVYEKAFLPDDQIIVESVDRTEQRVQIILVGTKSGNQGNIYPNFKNSWKNGGASYPAYNWVKTPCFHVWISKSDSN